MGEENNLALFPLLAISLYNPGRMGCRQWSSHGKKSRRRDRISFLELLILPQKCRRGMKAAPPYIWAYSVGAGSPEYLSKTTTTSSEVTDKMLTATLQMAGVPVLAMLSKSKGLVRATRSGRLESWRGGSSASTFIPFPTVAEQGLPLQEPAFQGQK